MTCSTPDCDNASHTRGMCRPHYQAHWAAGRTAPCTFADCGKLAWAKGLCHGHYQQHREGRALAPLLNQGAGWLDNHGYHKVRVGGKTLSQHRVVMEQMLGRPLFADENVHHINGVRNDNRPENLELWSKSQPAGQRVEDKLAWAEEILRRYGRG